METKSSRISGFYKLPPEERLEKVADIRGLSDEDLSALRDHEVSGVGLADRMIENVIGTMQIPLGVATNFVINSKDYLIPMAIEEPSVVAAASNAARLARETGGFFTSNSGPIMRAQIQATGVSDPEGARARVFEAKEDLLELANEQDSMLVQLGGGAKDIEVHVIRSDMGPMVVTHLIVDCKDSMGANAVNTMAEAHACRSRPLPRRNAKQGRDERHIGRGPRYRQRHEGRRGWRAYLRGALGALRVSHPLGEERRRRPRGEHRDAPGSGPRGWGNQVPPNGTPSGEDPR